MSNSFNVKRGLRELSYAYTANFSGKSAFISQNSQLARQDSLPAKSVTTPYERDNILCPIVTESSWKVFL